MPSMVCMFLVGGLPLHPQALESSLSRVSEPRHLHQRHSEDTAPSRLPFSVLQLPGRSPLALPSHPIPHASLPLVRPRLPGPLRAASSPLRTEPCASVPTSPLAGGKGPGPRSQLDPVARRQAQSAALGRSSTAGRRGARALGAEWPGSCTYRDLAEEETEVCVEPSPGLGAVALAANCHSRCPRRRHSLGGFPASCGGAAAKSSRLRRAAGASGTGSSDPQPAAPLPLLPTTQHARLRGGLERSSAGGLPRKGFRTVVPQRLAFAFAYGTAEC